MPALKVVHIAPTPFFADRGCHIRIRNEIFALRQQQVRIILCTYHHGNDVSGIEIRRIPRIPGYTKLDAGYSPFRFIADIFLFFLVLRTVWRERPDVIHGHLHEGALIGWSVKILLFWRRIPLLMDMQGSLSGELAAYGAFSSFPLLLKMFRLAERFICSLPDFFCCSSEASSSMLLNDFKVNREKVMLLQDVVPDELYSLQDQEELRKKIGVPADKTVLIYTGSLLEGKGIQYIWESIRLLAAKRDDIIWLLVGYPMDATVSYLEQYGLQDLCLLAGQLPYSELPVWLGAADIALEPKSDEAGEASGKLLHYMAAALPVVCFTTENNRKLLAENGFFASTPSPEAFCEAIIDALDDQGAAKERGLQNRETVRIDHSMAAVEKKLVDVYTRLTAKKH